MIAADADVLRAVEQFVYREARLCDEQRYDEWEALWTDDGVYWVPANGDDTDPTTADVDPVRQPRPHRHPHQAAADGQAPRPVAAVAAVPRRRRTSRCSATTTATSSSSAAFVLYESRTRGLTPWVGRVRYRLRRADDGTLRMAAKTVFLVDNDQPLHTLAFLI